MTIIPPPATQTVVIQFEGICVNFRRSDFPFLPAAHRIVLINASTITDVWGNIIFPHLAGFTVGSDPTVPTTPLSGSVVRITNAVKTGVTYIPEGEPDSYDAIESLTALTPGLSGPSLAVLVGQNPEVTACCFDVDDGVIGSAPSGLGATMTIVTIQTTGDPLYQLTPFPTGLSSAQIFEVPPQPATNQMFFSNEEIEPSQGSDNDFLLSYLVVDPPPVGTPTIPTSATGTPSPNRKSMMAAKLPPPQKVFSDVGCSNSQFP